MAVSRIYFSEEEFNQLREQFKPPKFKVLTPIPVDQRCPMCVDTVYYRGCPHCGNTFIKREILRQTA
jgi:predicted RNA-binding Zn-ribbon protein involved in translation (DUF1610 family)